MTSDELEHLMRLLHTKSTYPAVVEEAKRKIRAEFEGLEQTLELTPSLFRGYKSIRCPACDTPFNVKDSDGKSAALEAVRPFYDLLKGRVRGMADYSRIVDNVLEKTEQLYPELKR